MSEEQKMQGGEEEVGEDIFTFKNIFYFAKRSIPRVLVYLLAALFAASVVLSILYYGFFKKRGYAAMQIEFNYPGAEQGVDPMGEKLDVNYIKSTSVIRSALNELNYDIDANVLRNNIYVTPVIPNDVALQYDYINQLIEKDPTNWEKLNALKFQPTSFTIELYDPSLKEVEAKQILTEIVSQYERYFIDRYQQLGSFGLAIIDKESVKAYDFVDVLSIYQIQMRQFENYCQNLVSMYGNYKSYNTIMTINDLYVQANALRSYSLKEIDQRIELNNVTKYTYGEFIKALELQKRNNASEIAVTTGKIDSLKIVLAEYAKYSMIVLPGSSGGEPVTVTVPSSYHDSLASQLVAAETDKAYYENANKRIDERIAVLQQLDANGTSSEALKAEVAAMFDVVNAEYNVLVEKSVATLEEYYSEVYMKDAIDIVIPAIYIVQDLSSMNAGLVLIIVAAAAITIGFAETGVRIYRESQKKQTAKTTA